MKTAEFRRAPDPLRVKTLLTLRLRHKRAASATASANMTAVGPIAAVFSPRKPLMLSHIPRSFAGLAEPGVAICSGELRGGDAGADKKRGEKSLWFDIPSYPQILRQILGVYLFFPMI